MRVAVALALGVCAAAGGCAGGGRALLVGSDLDNPPFAFVDEQGEPAGRDVEMMEAIAGELGRGLAWRRMPFEELLDAAARGDVDVVCATLGITPERSERVLFTIPYFETRLAVLVRAAPGEPGKVADLLGRRVAASPGTTSERALRLLLSHAEPVLDGGKGAPTTERLLAGEVDAAVMDGPAAAKAAAESGGRLRVLAEPLAAEHYALALPPGRVLAKAQFDAALERLRASGVLAELDARHGLAEEPAAATQTSRVTSPLRYTTR